MTMENSGHKDTDRRPANGQSSTHAQVSSPSRRRFTRAGVGASAVLLTLTSRSVLAKNGCTSPSGFASLNLSHPDRKAAFCDGLGIESWLDTNRKWPVDRTTPFKAIFGNSSLAFRTGGARKFYDAFPSRDDSKTKASAEAPDSTFDDATLFDVLNGSATPEVVKQLIVAYLNYMDRRSSFPTDLQAIAMFKEWQQKGTYTPSAGITWSTADILTYLDATQGR